ncbi:MAG: hypothetical protein KDE27_00810 [Planctomycetes bacterium]|nr:hypothetical protein [Planctomycetota bacterium]
MSRVEWMTRREPSSDRLARSFAVAALWFFAALFTGLGLAHCVEYSELLQRFVLAVVPGPLVLFLFAFRYPIAVLFAVLAGIAMLLRELVTSTPVRAARRVSVAAVRDRRRGRVRGDR